MKKVVLSALAATIVTSAVYAESMTLFSDPKTGQVYTSAGEGRVEMGDFIDAKSVDKHFREDESQVAEFESNTKTYIEKAKKNWANKMSIRGYTQIRNTEWLDGEGQDTNPVTAGIQQFGGLYSDGSTANDRNFFIRRARIILFGSAGDHVDYYLQPDFASLGTGSAQLRDFYADINIDKEKEHRVRIGMSKVPYGFENMQSSSNRLALDRNDALNSGTRDERDTGAFYYYTPVAIQDLFKEINDLGLKHSGNYGMFALGAYNGQGANQTERNGNYHIAARLTYPFKTSSGQIFEFGIQGYKGDYVPVSTTTPGSTVACTDTLANTACRTTTNDIQMPDGLLAASKGINDERVGITAIMYQQPFGLQGEWTWGKTPGADSAPVTTNPTTSIRTIRTTISEKNLNGGYLQAMYRLTDVLKTGDVLTPFVKYQYFDGYSKAELNAPKNQISDWEFGAEWQMTKGFELSAEIHKMNRTDITQLNGYGTRFEGTALRVQAQFNY